MMTAANSSTQTTTLMPMVKKSGRLFCSHPSPAAICAHFPTCVEGLLLNKRGSTAVGFHRAELRPGLCKSLQGWMATIALTLL